MDTSHKMADSAYETSGSMEDEPVISCSVEDLTTTGGCSTDSYTSSGSVEDFSASNCSVDGISSSGCSADDDYLASIELSNSCREFYHNHVKSTAAFKQSSRARRQKQVLPPTGMDAAMERLRKEMAELMDQDLSLMEQLLTLNDRIEEMKHNYMYSASKNSLYSSSCFTGSMVSLSDSRVFDEMDNTDDVIDHVVDVDTRDSNSSTPTTCKQSLTDSEIVVAQN